MANKVYRLLAITDTAEHSWKATIGPRKADDDTYAINLDSGEIGELKLQLTNLLKSGTTFQNAIFTTHGHDGVIWFADRYINADVLYLGFYRSGLERLFPLGNAKIYFAGCNVASGDKGWNFLKAAAMAFLRYAGGSAIGWTSLGFNVPSWVPGIGGHVEHVWGGTRKVEIVPGPGSGADLHYYESALVPNPGSGIFGSVIKPGWREVSAP